MALTIDEAFVGVCQVIAAPEVSRERALVVAYLRHKHLDEAADFIERGHHRPPEEGRS